MKKKLTIGDKGIIPDLKINQKAKVISIHNQNKALRRRLFDMGLTEGVTIIIKKIAPLGDPIDIELRGYELCLRHDDVKNIEIEVIE